jgi:hypothetical protein
MKPKASTNLKQLISQSFDYVKEHCENFEHDIHEDAKDEEARYE